MWAPYGDNMHDDGERLPTEPEQTVEAAELEEQTSVLLADPVVRHRAKKMAKAGLNPRQARALALDRAVDSTSVVNVLEAGCDPDTAFDIFS